MPRACLTKDEIKALTGLVREVFSFLKGLRFRNSLAAEIQFPKIPPVLSQSIKYLRNISRAVSV